MAGIDAVRPFRVADAAFLRAIAEAAWEADELPGTTRRVLDDWLSTLIADSNPTFVALAGDEIVGFFAPDFPVLVVAPDHRHQGHGTRLVKTALAAAGARGRPRLYLAPPRGRAGAVAFATRLGFVPHASLWQLRLPPEVRPPGPAFPASVAARPFGPVDLPAYVNLINAAFVDHPSPLSVTEPLVRHVHDLPGFDPTDILVVEPRDHPGHLIAFCRTRLVRDGGMTAGEVVLIGVHPEHRGAGLGTELLRWGVDRLRGAGTDEITLTVESLNERALRLYERTGFERVQEWPRWAKAT